MTKRSVTHSEVFPIDTETLFLHLITPSAIRGWWGVARAIVVPEVGGHYALAWGEDEDKPDTVTVGVIQVFEPGKILTVGNYSYTLAEGKHPFSIADMQVRYKLLSADQGTLLTVVNSGFPVEAFADDFYNGCIQGWRDTFSGIRSFLEQT